MPNFRLLLMPGKRYSGHGLICTMNQRRQDNYFPSGFQSLTTKQPCRIFRVHVRMRAAGCISAAYLCEGVAQRGRLSTYRKFAAPA